MRTLKRFLNDKKVKSYIKVNFLQTRKISKSCLKAEVGV